MNKDILVGMLEHQQLIDKMIRINSFADGQPMVELISKVVDEICMALLTGKKILFCGNGGSAADAEHLAAELSGRFKMDRAAFNAMALAPSSAFITAVANDFGYEQLFLRAIDAHAEQGDVLVCLSTSGNSENVVLAAREASKRGIRVITISGDQGVLRLEGRHALVIPSKDTARIQEVTMLIGHLICEQVEMQVVKK